MYICIFYIYVCVEVCVIRMSLLLVIYDQVYFRKLNTTTLESIDLEMCLKENNSFNELCFFFPGNLQNFLGYHGQTSMQV